nr:MAG TPA: hypothetical protein [Caudoviricetes sp.]
MNSLNFTSRYLINRHREYPSLTALLSRYPTHLAHD